MAAEYRKFVNYTLNKELPSSLKVKFIHYDVKDQKKKNRRNFPMNLFDKAVKILNTMGFFSCIPKRDKTSIHEAKCLVDIQRGVVRTNCIDSLDRTNFA